MWNWDHGFGTHWFGAVVMIVTLALFLGSLTALVIALLRGFGRADDRPANDAEKILDERFARGEIDEEELNRRRTALHSRR
jgi:putative membrane protein